MYNRSQLRLSVFARWRWGVVLWGQLPPFPIARWRERRRKEKMMRFVERLPMPFNHYRPLTEIEEAQLSNLESLCVRGDLMGECGKPAYAYQDFFGDYGSVLVRRWHHAVDGHGAHRECCEYRSRLAKVGHCGQEECKRAVKELRSRLLNLKS